MATTKTTTTVTTKKPLLDKILGKDSVVEERKVVTVTETPDGTRKVSEHVERVKVEKGGKKKDKDKPKVQKTYVKEDRSGSPPRRHHSPPKHHQDSSSYATTARCANCDRKAKSGASFCEHCGGRVVAGAAKSKYHCEGCGEKLKHDAKFCEACGAPCYHLSATSGSRPLAKSGGSSSSSGSSGPHLTPFGQDLMSSSGPSHSSHHHHHRSGGSDGPHLTPLGKQLFGGPGSNLHRTPEGPGPSSSHHHYKSSPGAYSSSKSSSSSHGSTGIRCKTCHCEIRPGESYVKRKGRTYCQSHGYEKCKGCRGPLTGTYLKYKDKQYHHDCFRCSVCNVVLGTTFYAHPSSGRPVCYSHK